MSRFRPDENSLDKYSKLDGTIEFYGRIRAILKSELVVLDLGAGRGGWYFDDESEYRKSIRFIKNDVARLIACDVDEAVLQNQSAHENRLIEDGCLPAADGSVDVVIADYVLEHVENPGEFYSEVDRVLKPGGFFCARTPHVLNYVALAARVVKSRFHAKLLERLQPGRQVRDVFPTAYKLNTFRSIRHYWRPGEWKDYSYVYVAEPHYFLGSRLVYKLISFAHKHLPALFTGNLFLFLRKNHRS